MLDAWLRSNPEWNEAFPAFGVYEDQYLDRLQRPSSIQIGLDMHNALENRNDKIKLEKFRKKCKKKRFGGSGRPRANYRDLKRDLDGFHYDDVINKQLYHTRRGQEIWLQLGFPYQKDEK